MARIEPTVGRIVWYRHPYAYDEEPRLAAIITKVWSPERVGLAVFRANGELVPMTNVMLRQEDDDEGDEGYCEWMPYQKGQAAKTEALEKKLGE